jgi:hypothetical protein
MVWKRLFSGFIARNPIKARLSKLQWFLFLDYCIFIHRPLSRSYLSEWSGVDAQYIIIRFDSGIDALVIIPFSKLRAYQNPMVYAIIK